MRATFQKMKIGFGMLPAMLLSWCAATVIATAAPLAHWSMDATGLHNPAVLDSQIDEAVECLWSPNSVGNTYATSADVPPVSMRAVAVDNGWSYNAAAIANVDGALLYPQATYGDRFSFADAFTIELFFKTDGDKAGSGVMQLLRQGDSIYRYGLSVNEPAPGAVRFAIRNVAGLTNSIEVATRNFADGQWHYVVAVFDPVQGLSLTVVNSDNTSVKATAVLSTAFGALPVRNDGNLLIGRNTYSRTASPRTFLGLIDEVRISQGVTPVAELAGVVPGPVARWGMTAAGGYNPATLDAVASRGSNNLITFNNLSPAHQYTTSTDVPPTYMFGNGQSAGSKSFSAGSLSTVDGALFYPQDTYEDVFNFTGVFSIEMFFKTSGNRSGSGFMQLLMQGENSFRYGLILNEPGAGNVRFALNDKQGTISVVDLTGRNYADGTWHYLMARYNPAFPPNGLLTLTIANQDGSSDTATAVIPAIFKGLPAEGDGNLLIGRNAYSLSQNPRTFLGLIDEVQISAGAPPASQRLGKLPAPPVLSAVPVAGAVSVAWSTSPAETYTVEYTESLDPEGKWVPIHTQTASGNFLSFTETDPVRLSQRSGFYRVTLR